MSTQETQNSEYTPDSAGWSAALYNTIAPFVYSSAAIAPVLELLSAQPGERIIDFGCGSGEVTLNIEKIVTAKAGGTVVGVDFSQSMVSIRFAMRPAILDHVFAQVDKATASGLQNVFVVDIQSLDWEDLGPKLVGTGSQPGHFDAVFSNAALHWCKRDPAGVIQSAKRVLKPGGRFVAEMGGFLNCVGVRSALHAALRRRGYDPIPMDPWFFPSVEEYASLLRAAGFEPKHISLNPRFTALPAGLPAWLRLFARNSFLSTLDDAEAEVVMNEVVDACAVDCRDAEGNWALMYVRLRFYATVQ